MEVRMTLREDAEQIIRKSIRAVLPDEAVRKALEGRKFGQGKLYMVAAGKAGWQMAKTAADILGDRLAAGVVVTKYGHVKGEIPRTKCYEAGHPVPDENSFLATQAALDLAAKAGAGDEVVFLLSGGGSALFEKPLVSGEELRDVTEQLLACGADIVEINTIRKRLSAVKGGRFAALCAPARVFSVVLSDIIGDPLDMIASGPAYPDSSTEEQARAVAEKYGLTLTEEMRALLAVETPKSLDNVETHITGSVRQLCLAAQEECRALGYTTVVLTASLSCTAREAGAFLANIAQYHHGGGRKLAFLAGGETVVQLTGGGLGGRNQELALAAAPGLAVLSGAAVFSLGSDGTDGPTDAAGGYVDGSTAQALGEQVVDIFAVLKDNDSYHALEKTGGLIKTGPTGTNVNDIAAVLIEG